MLRLLGIAGITGAMSDVSEGGCLCKVAFDSIDMNSAEIWKQVILPGRMIGLEMTEPPELCNLRVEEAEIRWVKPTGFGGVEFGLLFRTIEPGARELLQRTLLTWASSRLRGKRNPMTDTPTESEPAAPIDAQSWLDKEAARDTPLPMRRVQPLSPPPQPQPGLARTPARPLPSHASPRGIPTPPPKLPAPATRTFARPFEAAPPIPPPRVRSSGSEPSLSDLSETSSLPRPLGSASRTPAVRKTGSFKRHLDVPLPPTPEMTRPNTPPLEPRRGTTQVPPQMMQRREPDLSSGTPRQARQKIMFWTLFQFCDSHGVGYNESPLQGHTVDMSEGGFLLEGPPPDFCDAKRFVELKACLRISIKYDAHTVDALCRVRSVQQTGELCQYGLQIIEMDPEGRKQLRELYIRAGLSQMRRTR